MIHSPKFTALLDANVLYPAPLRDFLLHLADLELYKPKWTDKIQEEWMSNLIKKRPDLRVDSLEKTRIAMDSAFPDSNVFDYEDLISGLTLPDENDRHVLAAAIRTSADVIITFNLKDFPHEYLNKYDIDAQHPDDFVTNLIGLDKERTLKALENQAKNLRNPPKTVADVLITLGNCGLINSVSSLKR